MAGSSILGLLIARQLGSSGSTDGFFAANTVYGIALFAAQSLRTTAPASLVDERPGVLAAHARSVAALAGATIALFLAIALAADLLLPSAGAHTLRIALLILAPAAVAQLYAGLLAARCGVLGSFIGPALAYAGGTITMAAAFVVLESPLGVDAIATAIAIGALGSTALMAVFWIRAERRPAVAEHAAIVPVPTPASAVPAAQVAVPTAEASPPPAHRLTGRLLRGALPVLASQVIISISTFAAGHTGSGNGTLYTYGVLVIGVLTAVVASPVSIVLAADVARTWDRRPESLAPLVMRTYRLGLILLPALAIPLLLIGPAPARAVLTALSPGDIDDVFLVAAILTPAVLATLLSMVPLGGTIAAGTVGRVGTLSLLVAAVHAVLAAGIAISGSFTALAVEGLIAAVTLSAMPVVVAMQHRASAVGGSAIAATAKIAAPGPVAALAVWLLMGASTDLVPGLFAAVVGLLAHSTASWIFARADLDFLTAATIRRGRPG